MVRKHVLSIQITPRADPEGGGGAEGPHPPGKSQVLKVSIGISIRTPRTLGKAWATIPPPQP